MNSKKQHLFRALLLSGAVALMAPQLAAAATPACTQISNTAHVNYDVGGIPQGPGGAGINSNTVNFYVGVKVDVVVSRVDGAPVGVNPNQTGATLTYNVLNNGNVPMKYVLTTTPEGNGTLDPYPPNTRTDNFDATLASITTNGTAGLTSTIVTLAAGANQNVLVTGTIPATQVNNDFAVYGLTAQSQWVGSTTDIIAKNGTATGAVINDGGLCAALPAVTFDVVSADGAGSESGDVAYDGKHSIREAFIVAAAGLTITKASAVYWDPVNLYVSPKAIPGAVVTYTITIANANGAAQADNVNISDSLNAMIANLTFANSIPVVADPLQINTSFRDAVNNCTLSGVGYGIVVNGTCKTNVYAGLDGASWNDVADANGGTNIVSATGLTVPGNSSAVVKYQVTIQ